MYFSSSASPVNVRCVLNVNFQEDTEKLPRAFSLAFISRLQVISALRLSFYLKCTCVSILIMANRPANLSEMEKVTDLRTGPNLSLLCFQ